MTVRPPVRARSWAEVRWRQFRNAPRPVFRAVAADAGVAALLGTAYLAYDVALSRGARLPGGDLRTLAVAGLVLGIVVAGSLVTYVIVPQPTGSSNRPMRSTWSAALGFLAGVPIAYLTLVLVVQILKPFLV